MLRDFVCEIAMACRVDAIKSGTEHRDRRRGAAQPAPMRGCIDAQSESTYDREAGVTEGFGESLSICQSAWRRITTPYHGQRGMLQQI